MVKAIKPWTSDYSSWENNYEHLTCQLNHEGKSINIRSRLVEDLTWTLDGKIIGIGSQYSCVGFQDIICRFIRYSQRGLDSLRAHLTWTAWSSIKLRSFEISNWSQKCKIVKCNSPNNSPHFSTSFDTEQKWNFGLIFIFVFLQFRHSVQWWI